MSEAEHEIKEYEKKFLSLYPQAGMPKSVITGNVVPTDEPTLELRTVSCKFLIESGLGVYRLRIVLVPGSAENWDAIEDFLDAIRRTAKEHLAQALKVGMENLKMMEDNP